MNREEGGAGRLLSSRSRFADRCRHRETRRCAPAVQEAEQHLGVVVVESARRGSRTSPPARRPAPRPSVRPMARGGEQRTGLAGKRIESPRAGTAPGPVADRFPPKASPPPPSPGPAGSAATGRRPATGPPAAAPRTRASRARSPGPAPSRGTRTTAPRRSSAGTPTPPGRPGRLGSR